MKLIIDARESRNKIKKFEDLGFEVEFKNIPIGDFVCEEKGIVIERKTVEDFVGSFRSGRIVKQLQQMEQFEHKYLIIIGAWKDLYFKKVTITKEQICGMLSSIAVRYNAKMVHVDNENDFVRVVAKICDKTDDGKSINIYDTDLLKSNIKNEDILVMMLACVPGISVKTAKKILDKFDFFGLVNCSEEDLISIDGIGKKLAEKVKNVFKNET